MKVVILKGSLQTVTSRFRLAEFEGKMKENGNENVAKQKGLKLLCYEKI